VGCAVTLSHFPSFPRFAPAFWPMRVGCAHPRSTRRQAREGDAWDTGCKEGGAVTIVEKAVVESVVPGFLSGVVGASLLPLPP